MRSGRTVSLVRSALVVALIAVGALIAVPLGPVPVTLQVLVLAVAALILTPGEAAVTLGVYVALGLGGAPVFAGGAGGPGVLLGPTGGFIVGFAFGVPAAALIRRALTASAGTAPYCGVAPGRSAADVAALAVFLAVSYTAGLIGFLLVTGLPVAEAVMIAVAPFVVIDAIKCVIALAVARAVRAAQE